jgi:hypothetical protein
MVRGGCTEQLIQVPSLRSGIAPNRSEEWSPWCPLPDSYLPLAVPAMRGTSHSETLTRSLSTSKHTLASPALSRNDETSALHTSESIRCPLSVRVSGWVFPPPVASMVVVMPSCRRGQSGQKFAKTAHFSAYMLHSASRHPQPKMKVGCYQDSRIGPAPRKASRSVQHRG